MPGDHTNCAIGAHTHAIPLPAARAQELEQTLTFMTGLGYVTLEEVPSIPRLPEAPGAVVYAPLGDTPVDPDVVLVAGRPGRVMLLQEATIRAGIAAPTPLLARPTCMARPAALAQGVVASTGCVGNRVYTDLGDDELYVAIPGRALATLVAELGTITAANTALGDYHSPFLPFSNIEYIYTMVPRDVFVPNLVANVGVIVLTLLIAVRRGRTPLEFVHAGFERQVVETIRLRVRSIIAKP